MSTTPQEPIEAPEHSTSGNGNFRWLVVVVVVLGLAMGYIAYAQYQIRTEMRGQFQTANTKLTRLDARAATMEDNYATLKAVQDETVDKLGLTQQQVARARQAARQIKEEQQRAAAELATQLEQQQNQLGSLTGEVTEVKGTVAETQETLETTMTKLERTIGDLGLQSGLIARNKDELEELKQRGERDYFEFDLKKSKKYTRVGDISVRLNKADRKRQKYTMTLLLDDKRIEKKDKTLLEPVQFYMLGTRHLLEIVVYQVDKDNVTGYLSVPKELAMASRSGG